MFIKFKENLYNMTNINTVECGELINNEQIDNPVSIGYLIRLIDINGKEIVTKCYTLNQVKKWEKECYRVEQWLLGYR